MLHLTALLATSVLLPCASATQDPAATGLDVILLASHVDHEMDRWHRITPPSRPDLPTVGTVHPGEPFELLVIVRGLGDLGDGTSRATWSLRHVRADGEPGLAADDMPCYDGPASPLLQLASSLPTVALDVDEPLGETTFTATVHDEATGRSASDSVTLELAAWRYEDIPLPEDLHEWIARYHASPQPWKLPRVFLEGGVPETQDAAHVVPAFRFFEILFAEHGWLVDHMVERVETLPPRGPVLLVALLHRLGDERAGRLAEPLGAEDVAAVEALLTTLDVPLPESLPTAPVHVDLLWAEFLATARFEPVRRIVSALAPLAPDGGEDEPMADLVARAAAWSLASNMRQHPLVYDYCWTLVQPGVLDEDERASLAALVAEVVPDRVRITTPEGDDGTDR